MTREEAAADAIDNSYDQRWREFPEPSVMATLALAAADAHDAANGVHRIVIDSATVERAAEVLLSGTLAWCHCKRSPFDKHDVNPPCSTRILARETARAVLAAAVKEDG